MRGREKTFHLLLYSFKWLQLLELGQAKGTFQELHAGLTQVSGAHGLGQSLAAFPGALAGSGIRSRAGMTETVTLI